MENKSSTFDRVGLGWRPEIAIDIYENLEQIDILELVAENYADFSKRDLTTFKRLSSAVPIMVHSISLGLASMYRVSQPHLDKVARIVDVVEPEAWSDHLAFVRTPDAEIGHLAAPPWSNEVIESTLLNIEIATQKIESKPHLENIATLYLPPGSELSETEWTSQIINRAQIGLLIDLENIYANCINFNLNCFEQLSLFPLQNVKYVHIAGGRSAHDKSGSYFLDDHAHAVNENVFALLEELAARVVNPLSVILERDNNFPPMTELLAELESARKALERGRSRQQKVVNG